MGGRYFKMYIYVKFRLHRVDNIDIDVHFTCFRLDILLGGRSWSRFRTTADGADRRRGGLKPPTTLLLESGVDSVRISPLAKKLGLSRTSFYWFFKDREELLAALVDPLAGQEHR